MAPNPAKPEKKIAQQVDYCVLPETYFTVYTGHILYSLYRTHTLQFLA